MTVTVTVALTLALSLTLSLTLTLPRSILMSNTPACITPAAGKLEDQQLGASWKHIEKRCRDAGISVSKPSRFDAVQFAVEYDLHMEP